MKKHKKTIIFAAILVLVAVAAFLIGRLTANKDYSWLPSVSGQTFYAKILEIDGNYFHVEGLEINDINHRGEFTFTVSEDTMLEWRNTKLLMTSGDLDVGDLISITYSGSVQETYPARLTKVDKITLLDDER